MIIIPAILPKSYDELVKKLGQLSDAQYTGSVQIDLCDGDYVPFKTWPFTTYDSTDAFLRNLSALEAEITNLKPLLSKFPIDLDLMVRSPEQLLSLWDMFSPTRIIVHLDAIDDIEGFSISMHSEKTPFAFIRGRQTVFAISHTTDISKFQYWYDEFGCRIVQIMGIEHIGQQGEPFSEKTLEIIESLQKIYPQIEIQVDGGVSIPVVKRLSEYGVAACVAGSAVFHNDQVVENLAELARAV